MNKNEQEVMMNHSMKKRIFHPIYRVMAVLLTASLLMVSLSFPMYAAETDSCGGDITWTLEEGVLTLSGSGAMMNFQDGKMAPWHERREEILSSLWKLAPYSPPG